MIVYYGILANNDGKMERSRLRARIEMKYALSSLEELAKEERSNVRVFCISDKSLDAGFLMWQA